MNDRAIPNSARPNSAPPPGTSAASRDIGATLDDYRWLVGSEAADGLATCAANREPLHIQVARLRKSFSAARCHLLLEQVALRRRAQDKFAAAQRMFFTPVGLEQSTDELLARYKAGRFPHQQPAADLCCGIGGDLLGLAARGPVSGYDRDPITALLAEANLLANGFNQVAVTARVLAEDVLTADLQNVAAWHIDPDRRPEGRRTTRVIDHQPGVDVLEQLLAVNGNAAIKLAPAAELPPDWPGRAEQNWISTRGECRQLVAWFGTLAVHSGQRSATVLHAGHDGSVAPRVVTGPVEPVLPAVADMIGAYLYEPDAAVLAAQLTGVLAAEHGLSCVAAGVAYLTGDRPIDDPALAGFKVLEVMPYRAKPLKAWLRARGMGRLEVKKRGVPLDPAQVQASLRVPGDAAATLLLTKMGASVTAILAERLPR